MTEVCQVCGNIVTEVCHISRHIVTEVSHGEGPANSRSQALGRSLDQSTPRQVARSRACTPPCTDYIRIHICESVCITIRLWMDTCVNNHADAQTHRHTDTQTHALSLSHISVRSHGCVCVHSAPHTGPLLSVRVGSAPPTVNFSPIRVNFRAILVNICSHQRVKVKLVLGAPRWFFGEAHADLDVCVH